MTQAVSRILAEVERLSPPERTDLRRALVERVPMSEEDFTEEDFAALAAERFANWTRKKLPTAPSAVMPLSPERGEVWQVDFGIAQKVRPALVISVPYADADRALIGVIPHTTATRGSQWEVIVPTRYLSEGAFLV